MEGANKVAAKASVIVGTLLFLISVVMSWRRVDTPLSDVLLWAGFVLVLAPSLGAFTRRSS